MFVIVRDEDVPTVAGAVGAVAQEAGLEQREDDDALGVLAMMGSPQVRVSQAEGQVVIEGLDTLDLAEGDEWAASLAKACSAEVIAIEGAEVGLLVHVHDEEAEPTITILRKGNRWDTSAIAFLADEEAGETALTQGILADDLDDLAAKILGHLGATPTDDAVSLFFQDPLEEEGEGLRVDAYPAVHLEGKVGGPVVASGPVYAVSLEGVPEVEGLRLVFGGDALPQVEIEAVEIGVRTRGANDLVLRRVTPSHADEESVIFLVPDAYLASTQQGLPPLDGSDLFSSMQALMSATGNSMLNTMTVRPIAKGKVAGSALLTLVVGVLDGSTLPTAEGEALVQVRA